MFLSIRYSGFLFLYLVTVIIIASCSHPFGNTEQQSVERNIFDNIVVRAEKVLANYPDSAINLADSALKLAFRLVEKEFPSKLLYRPYTIKAKAYWEKGLTDSSFSILTNADLQFRRMSDTLSKADTELLIGQYRLNTGQLYMAENHLLNAIRLFETTGHEEGQAKAMMSYGQLLTERGEYMLSQKYLTNAYQILLRIGNTELGYAICIDIGNNHADMNRFDDALFYYRIAEKGPYPSGSLNTRISALINIGILYRETDPDSALYYFRQALQLDPNGISMMDKARLKLNMANVYISKSNYDLSLSIYREVLDECVRNRIYPGVIRACNGISVVYENLGNYQKAIEYAQKALDVADSIGDVKMSVRLLEGLAPIYSKINDPAKSASLYEKAITLSDSIFKVDKLFANREMEQLNAEHQKELEFDRVSAEFQKERSRKRIYRAMVIFLAIVSVIIALILRKIYKLYQDRYRAYDLLVEKYYKERQLVPLVLSDVNTTRLAAASSPDPENTEALLKELISYFQKEKPYLDSKLRLETVTERLKCTHRNLISAMKGFRYPNFAGFTNYFRVEEAIRLMEDPKYKNYKIEAIANMAGFGNKVSFYSAFEKQVGVKPSWFRSSVMDKMKNFDSLKTSNPNVA